jgi:PhnB protein
MAVRPIPEGYHSLTPYLVLSGAAEALEFYKKAFGAVEVMRMDGPDGRVMHAEIKIGDSMVMIGDECPQSGHKGPKSLGGSSVGLMFYVDGVDAAFTKAVQAGATVQRPVADMFWGDRMGTVVDPFGHVWSIATHVEDVSAEECKRRAEAFLKKAS